MLLFKGHLILLSLEVSNNPSNAYDRNVYGLSEVGRQSHDTAQLAKEHTVQIRRDSATTT